MKYELNIQQFSGPVEKLLELIELKKMEITELNLAEVTADFLAYIKTLNNNIGISDVQKNNDVNPRLLADFVAVAATLLLIKSKALLPDLKLSDDEEKSVYDLEARLKHYAEFKPAIVLLKKLFESELRFSISRPFLLNQEPVFYPAPNASVESLHSAIKNIFNELEKINLETKTIESLFIKLEEKIEEITKKIEEGVGNFSDIIKARSRGEIIVFFLALLHLLREQMIKVEQKEGFSDIVIEKLHN